jgi:hypothetical protein
MAMRLAIPAVTLVRLPLPLRRALPLLDWVMGWGSATPALQGLLSAGPPQGILPVDGGSAAVGLVVLAVMEQVWATQALLGSALRELLLVAQAFKAAAVRLRQHLAAMAVWAAEVASAIQAVMVVVAAHPQRRAA